MVETKWVEATKFEVGKKYRRKYDGKIYECGYVFHRDETMGIVLNKSVSCEYADRCFNYLTEQEVTKEVRRLVIHQEGGGVSEITGLSKSQYYTGPNHFQFDLEVHKVDGKVTQVKLSDNKG